MATLQTTTPSRRPSATLRRGAQALIHGLTFCLIEEPNGIYRFTDTSVRNEALPRDQVAFLLFLMEGRTCAEVLKALPGAVAACTMGDGFGGELAEYFRRLDRALSHHRPATRGGTRSRSMSGWIERPAQLDLPELPDFSSPDEDEPGWSWGRNDLPVVSQYTGVVA
ncbi:MAG: hypothetical protein ACREJ2_01270 [Planctomycetota bacterium]